MITSEISKRDGIKIIVGLGNPGTQYENTYHNVGRLAVLKISEAKLGDFSAPGKKPFKYFKIGNAVFIIPESFMNESGTPVRAALDYFNADIKDLVVIHDDSDIETGKWKLANSGSSGGHNGIKSIIEHLNTDDFTRIKIGIRGQSATKNDRRLKAGDFVLDKISREDLEKIFGAIVEIKKTSDL